MDQAAVDGLKRDFTVVYDPALVDQPDLLSAELKTAQAIIVRNRTQVRGDLLTCAKRLKAAAVAEYVIASIFIFFRKD